MYYRDFVPYNWDSQLFSNFPALKLKIWTSLSSPSAEAVTIRLGIKLSKGENPKLALCG